MSNHLTFRKSNINRQRFRKRSRIRSSVSGNKKPILREEFPSVSVIIPVWNEHRTISRVLQQVRGIHPQVEIIVVSNGSTDGTKELAEKAGVKVISFAKPLGHDVGRAIGAKEAKGEIILFIDGDIVIPTRQLIPFVQAIKNGVDVALNSYSGPIGKKKVHSVVLSKHVLNEVLFRPDLAGASLTTIPHALSRHALESIGIDNLAVPPKAHAIAVHKGLHVKPVYFVNVGKPNPIRRTLYKKDPLESLIVGDHLEALNWLFQGTNERGNRTDLTRLRDIVR